MVILTDTVQFPRAATALLLALATAVSPACGQEASEAAAIRYHVAFPNAAHHEAEVSVEFPDLPDTPLEIRMSRTSPGRYALHEFAKNVYSVRIAGADGSTPSVDRPDLHQWTVSDHGGSVTLRYTLFGDRIDGTYAAIDTEGAMLNVPASMMWARGLEDRPIRISFTPPAGTTWRAATQLQPTSEPLTFTAPGSAYFLDSPILLADFDLAEWTVDSDGASARIRFALHHTGTEADFARYIDMVKPVVLEEMAVYGELPAFDYGTYTFIASYLPWAAGDGMEHRNSTVLTRQGSLPDIGLSALGTVAHEFFHAWNIERIRPRSLEPFDFEAANVSRELWFGEGFTSYYDDLAMTRAGILDLPAFASRMASLVNTVTNSPGRRFFSPIEMSMQAPFVDAAVSVDPQNRANTFISYYTWGAALGLALDLEIRTRFPGRSLDDFMRAVWLRFGEPFEPYDVDGLEGVLAETFDDEPFAHEFFERFIRGTTRTEAVEVPDYPTLLASAGLRVRRRSEAPGLGTVRLRYENGRATVASPVLIGSPLYGAGVEVGDAIVSINGVALRNAAALDRALRGRVPGDRVGVVFESRGGSRTGQITLAPDPTLEIVPFEVSDEAVTTAVTSFRADWLGPRR